MFQAFMNGFQCLVLADMQQVTTVLGLACLDGVSRIQCVLPFVIIE
jgi:hypothetical protein